MGETTGNARAAWSVVLGVLSTLTMPLAVFVTRYSSSYNLPDSGYLIPVGAVLGIVALILARRARAYERVTLGRVGGGRTARVGRVLAIFGTCIAAASTISFAVYGLLVSIQ